MCLEKKDVRRLRKAQDRCGCSSLGSVISLAAQTKDVPRGFNLDAAIRDFNIVGKKGRTAVPGLEVPKFARAFTNEVLAQKMKGSSTSSPGSWARAKYSSGREARA
jgi:hypothetical protein